MAVLATRPEAVRERNARIARLIPGQKPPSESRPKGPHSVSADGTLRPTEESGQSPSVAALLELCLPTPFAGDDAPRYFWRSLLTDHGLILLSWWTVGCARTAITQALSVLHFGTKGLESNTALHFLGVGLLFGIATTLMGHSEGLYRYQTNSRTQIVILAKSVTWSSVLLAAVSRLAEIRELSTDCLISSAVLSFASVAGWKWWHDKRRQSASATTKYERHVLIVGTGSMVRRVAGYIELHPESGRTVRGLFDEDRLNDTTGLVEKLATTARAEFADEIILVAPSSRDLAKRIIREARRNHLDVKVIPDLYGCDWEEPRIERLGRVPLVTLHHEGLPYAGLFFKRMLDVAISGFALVMLWPVISLIAALVRLDSTGPAFYSAERVGRKGRRFRCHKFRTMIANAGDVKEKLRSENQRAGPTFKILADPRITRIGSWLRKYSLDELPQLWNVFKGEMSLVGPRPHPLDDFALYELEHLSRLDVTPGITGLWQVTARRSPSFHLNMALDLEYIESWSLWMDLQILFKTVAVVFQGTGA